MCNCISTLIQSTLPLLHSHKKHFPIKYVALSPTEQILSRLSRDPTPIRPNREREEQKQRCQSFTANLNYHPNSTTSCRNLAVACHHPIHTYESPLKQLQNTSRRGLLGTGRKAPNVFATKHPEVAASTHALGHHVQAPPKMLLHPVTSLFTAY